MQINHFPAHPFFQKFGILQEKIPAACKRTKNSSQNIPKKFSNNCMKVQEHFQKVHATFSGTSGCPPARMKGRRKEETLCFVTRS